MALYRLYKALYNLFRALCSIAYTGAQKWSQWGGKHPFVKLDWILPGSCGGCHVSHYDKRVPRSVINGIRGGLPQK